MGSGSVLHRVLHSPQPGFYCDYCPPKEYATRARTDRLSETRAAESHHRQFPPRGSARGANSWRGPTSALHIPASRGLNKRPGRTAPQPQGLVTVIAAPSELRMPLSADTPRCELSHATFQACHVGAWEGVIHTGAAKLNVLGPLPVCISANHQTHTQHSSTHPLFERAPCTLP